MKSAKQEVLSFVEGLPDDVSLEAILIHLQFKLDVLNGNEQFLSGSTSNQDEILLRLECSVAELERGEGIPNSTVIDWLDRQGR